MPCDNSTAFQLKPIKFWSDEKWGLDTPCVNEGYAHSMYVKRGRLVVSSKAVYKSVASCVLRVNYKLSVVYGLSRSRLRVV